MMTFGLSQVNAHSLAMPSYWDSPNYSASNRAAMTMGASKQNMSANSVMFGKAQDSSLRMNGRMTMPQDKVANLFDRMA